MPKFDEMPREWPDASLSGSLDMREETLLRLKRLRTRKGPAVANYPELVRLVAGLNGRNATSVFTGQVVPYLVDVWLSDYERLGGGDNVVETRAGDFCYLFDITEGRLLAAWGFSRGRFGGPRDKARMAGHPLSAGEHYHRGHAIAHTLGGETDINLVPQRGSVNIGAFRVLERRAVENPGALYFSYWTYRSRDDQVPVTVDQGLLVPGQRPDVRVHPN